MDDARQRIDDLVNRGLLDQWYAVAKSVQAGPAARRPRSAAISRAYARPPPACSSAWRITAAPRRAAVAR